MGNDGSGGPERIRPLSRDEAHPDVQGFYDQDLRAFGLVLNPTGVFAYRPEIMTAARGLNRAVAREQAIPASLRALICVRVASLVGCPF